MRLAIVHDYLNQYGGAERVLDSLHEIYPEAPIFTSIYDPSRMPDRYRHLDVRTSFMQRLPGVASHHQAYLACYPVAFEAFDFQGYDVVLSNSSAWAKCVITPPGTVHLCYCLTPMRWAWRYHDYVERERFGPLARFGLPVAMTALRLWDVTNSHRVDEFLAISRAVAGRIKKYYGRDSAIVYPPVDTSRFTPSRTPGDFYLVVSRLVPYKRVDLAIDAFNVLGLPLKIVGDGRDRERLRGRALSNIEFLGQVPDDEVVELVQTCRAFVFPGEEDFGIAPVEAQAAGKPVVAFGAGGALDTVLDGQTGVHFYHQTPQALVAAVHRLEQLDLDCSKIRAHSTCFDSSVFRHQITTRVNQAAGRSELPSPVMS